MNRRTFLGVAAPAFVSNLISAPRNSTLRLASFGAAGMAYRTLDGIATHPKVTLACVAEVDSARLAQVQKKYPKAKVYADWRRMLDKRTRISTSPALALRPPCATAMSIDLACTSTCEAAYARYLRGAAVSSNGPQEGWSRMRIQRHSAKNASRPVTNPKRRHRKERKVA
jgi:hypothetical protein